MNIPWPPAGTRPLAVDVVSVQSQVVYGRVGNNVALPTLDAFGLTAAAVPTVLLSNTPHYATLHGGAVPKDWFAGWLDDLVARGALEGLRAVLTGYLGSAGQARVLARWLRGMLEHKPDLRIVIDPVIGDHDHGVYVDPALVEAYRDELLPLADVVTPNGFEITQLAASAAPDLQGTLAAAQSLLGARTRCVVVTSAAPGACPSGSMQVLLAGRDRTCVATHPRIASEPKGTGDLFAAGLAAGWLAGDGLPEAAARACQRVIDGLRLTHAAGCAELLLPRGDARAVGHPEVVVRAL